MVYESSGSLQSSILKQLGIEKVLFKNKEHFAIIHRMTSHSSRAIKTLILVSFDNFIDALIDRKYHISSVVLGSVL